ncbi:hypothetical protein NUW58_g707 [Xylaria curta]|uniref:Uncharacterized protein n=1 Tax=Xylaria curta TaxID=42375 RepID=A0ACC1PN68_9PEZI|nr:hypothetical protein NUW58_g707 [Xylaria curta]
MSPPDHIREAFESAKDAFKKSLDNDEVFKDLLETSSIDDVWALTEKLQKQPYVERRMRHMAKISGFLDKLHVYTSTVDTFVSAKPEILALIWGPIRLLLAWTANDARFGDAVVSSMEKIGNALPQFGEMAKTFSESTKLGQVMALFFRDILEFYSITLKFFLLPRRRQFFEAIWPRQKEKIDLVAKQLEQHTASMKDEVTLLHIRAEHEARTRSLALFDQTAEFQLVQKFQALKIEVSPQTYSDRLDWLVNRSSDGSSDWLISKTFLAAAAVEEVRSHNNTLFVFVSHLQPTYATARSILQSLVFQLACQSKDAQEILVNSGARDVSSHAKDVSRLLKALLIESGPIFIIIDGLDEMELEERKILLQQLVDMDSCPETRVLFSSRPEDDIACILGTKAMSIYVDKRNSRSIEAYVRQRAQNWIENGNFDQQAQKEIQCLLSPIAARAEGMFLFARIILDNAELLTECQEIKQELKVLPLDLNDAYQRILSKINDLPSALRRKARTILGWIGCSPIPMTVHEMEQALLVDLDSKVAPSVSAPVRFVRICGPIVEVVGEIPQFVHFTVKEYIFSQQISRSINMSEAYHDLALSTLTYLSSDIINVNISDEKLRDNILGGKYRLYWFATGQWISLALRCMKESKDPSISPNLQASLLWLAMTLKNDKFEKQSDSLTPTFQYSESSFPEIAQIIDDVLHFRRNELQTEWNFINNHFTRGDIKALLYDLTRKGDINQLKEVATKLPRSERWVNNAAMGPARQLAAAMGSLPMVRILTYNDANDNPFSSETPLCSAMMRSENVDLFRWVLDSFRLSENIPTWSHLASEAFATSSPEMYSEWESFLLDPLRTLGGATTNTWSFSTLAPHGFRRASTLIPLHNKRYALFSDIAFRAIKKNAMYEERLIQTWNRLVEAIGPLDPRFLGFSLTRLAMSSKPSNKLGAELLRLGAPIDFPRGNASAIMEKSEMGAHRQADASSFQDRTISPRRRPYRRFYRGRTALHNATRGTSEEAVKFAQFLLAYGADPNYGYAGRKPEQEEGAALMQKWLGETWEELVERTRFVRPENMDLQNMEEQEEADDEGDDSSTTESRGRAKRRRTAYDGEEGNGQRM